MNCKNCYQEIPDGSKFCPHCGAKQNEVQANEVQPNAEQENAAGYQDVSGYQNNSGYKDVSGYQNNSGYQDAAGYQNNSGYQDAAGYQNNSGYQNVTGYQNNGQKPEINYVPYLILSIISTVCCCLPFGIVGIVFSVKINSAMNAGNYEEAAQDAKMAKIWTIVSFVVGLLLGIVYFVFGMMAGIDTYY
nr:CD225/dispanin family protein [uncultured Mediterraneibacter sp.]